MDVGLGRLYTVGYTTHDQQDGKIVKPDVRLRASGSIHVRREVSRNLLFRGRVHSI